MAPVLREDYDSLVVPLAVRETGRLDPIHEPSRPGVRPAVAFVGQRAHVIEERRSRISARCSAARPNRHLSLLSRVTVDKGAGDQGQCLLLLPGHHSGVVCLIFQRCCGLMHQSLRDPPVRGGVERLHVLIERVLERGGRRQQPLLEQQRNEPRCRALSRGTGGTRSQNRIAVQQVEQLLFLGGETPPRWQRSSAAGNAVHRQAARSASATSGGAPSRRRARERSEARPW